MSRLLDESFVLLPTPVCSLFSSPGSVFGFGVPTRVAVRKLRYAWQSDYLAKCLQEVLIWLVLTHRASSLVQAAEYQPALFAKRADLELRLGWYGWVIHFCVRASERPWVGSELAPGGRNGSCSERTRRGYLLRGCHRGRHVLDKPRASGRCGPRRPGLQRAALPRRLLARPFFGSGPGEEVGNGLSQIHNTRFASTSGWRRMDQMKLSYEHPKGPED